MTIYTDNGYSSRMDYLETLAEETGVPLYDVMMLSELLGPQEDFDGLVTNLDDWGYGVNYEFE